MSVISTKTWLNGALVETTEASPSIASISLHMGTGVFDGIMAYRNGRDYYLHEARAHFERFISGAGKMGMPIPHSPDDLERAALDLLTTQPPGDHYLRPIAYRAGPELWLTGAEGRPVDVSMFAIPVKRGVRTPVSCEISPVQRVSSLSMPVSWKVCGLYVNSFLARKGAESRGCQDAIMLDRRGCIAEMSAANLFFVSEQHLVTPKLTEDIFPGITRFTILRIAQQLGLDVVERDVYPNDIHRFSAAFLCSTLMEIRPISVIDGHRFASESNSTYERVAEAFDMMTRDGSKSSVNRATA